MIHPQPTTALLLLAEPARTRKPGSAVPVIKVTRRSWSAALLKRAGGALRWRRPRRRSSNRPSVRLSPFLQRPCVVAPSMAAAARWLLGAALLAGCIITPRAGAKRPHCPGMRCADIRDPRQDRSRRWRDQAALAHRLLALPATATTNLLATSRELRSRQFASGPLVGLSNVSRARLHMHARSAGRR